MFGNALIKHGEALKGHAGLYMKLIQDNPITMEMLRLVELDNNYRQILSESVELIKNDMDHFLVDYENLLGKM